MYLIGFGIFVWLYGLSKGFLIALSFIIGYYVFHDLIWEKRLNLKQKWKVIKFLQIIGFGCFTIGIFFWQLPSIIRTIGIFGILFSIYFRQILPKTKTLNGTLEQKIKADLKITGITKHKRFPRIFSRIGGFVVPYIPFFSLINKSWRKKRTKEAVIHENIHMYYLQNGAILIYIMVFFILYWITDNIFRATKYILPITVLYGTCMLVFFEFITFRKTNQYGKKLGIKTRKWNRRIGLVYFIIYFINIVLIVGVYYSIRIIIKNIF